MLIHGGCGASKRNIRLHFYHGISQQQAEETYYPQLPEPYDRKEQLANAKKTKLKK